MGGYRTIRPTQQYQDQFNHFAKSAALADIKFTYVVSCQIYGQMKASKEGRDRLCYQNILGLMTTYADISSSLPYSFFGLSAFVLSANTDGVKSMFKVKEKMTNYPMLFYVNSTELLNNQF